MKMKKIELETNKFKLETERLIIRDHIETDLEDLASLICSEEEMFYIMDIFAPDQEAAKENLKVAIDASQDPKRDKYFFAIIEKESLRYVGEIGFTMIQEGLAELGYFIKREFWNRGYVTEAGRAVVEYAFCTLGVHKIMTGCVKENSGSERVMIHLGFNKEGELKQHQRIQNEWKDRVVYGLLKDDYLFGR